MVDLYKVSVFEHAINSSEATEEVFFPDGDSSILCFREKLKHFNCCDGEKQGDIDIAWNKSKTVYVYRTRLL